MIHPLSGFGYPEMDVIDLLWKRVAGGALTARLQSDRSNLLRRWPDSAFSAHKNTFRI